MKHSAKITFILLGMFFITQLIGLFVIHQYAPQQTVDSEGNEITTYNLPYGMDPPEEVTPASTLISIVFAIAIAAFLMFFLMKYRVEVLLKVWFFVVVTLAIAITLNAFIISIPNAALIAFLFAIPLAYVKIFKRGMYSHNLTELIIYPGIASIFVPLLNIWSIVLLLILISLYDMYAVWHSGFMQKMAQYQIEKLKVFTGFFVPYSGKKSNEKITVKPKTKASKKKQESTKVSVAILGGGDVVFPLILAGVVFNTWGLLSALIIAVGATAALGGLFWLSEKGKFYPAMPFITFGCFIALGIAYLLQ